MLADQSDTLADSQIVEHFDQADFDPESVKKYRKDDSAMHEALREAVVNALVHADHPPEPARNKKKLAALGNGVPGPATVRGALADFQGAG